MSENITKYYTLRVTNIPEKIETQMENLFNRESWRPNLALSEEDLTDEFDPYKTLYEVNKLGILLTSGNRRIYEESSKASKFLAATKLGFKNIIERYHHLSLQGLELPITLEYDLSFLSKPGGSLSTIVWGDGNKGAICTPFTGNIKFFNIAEGGIWKSLEHTPESVPMTKYDIVSLDKLRERIIAE